MRNRPAKLPVLATEHQSKKSRPLLPVGTQVRLRRDPSGATGVVDGTVRNRLVVRWASDNWTGRHSVDALLVVKLPPTQPETDAQPKLNPYLRMLTRIDAENTKRAR